MIILQKGSALMKKGILLAVCLMLVGMLSIGGTYAYGESQSPLERIFSYFANVFVGPETSRNGASLDVKNLYLVRGEDKQLIPEQNNFLVPAALNKQVTGNDRFVDQKYNGYTYSLWSENYAPWAADKFICVQNNSNEDVFFRTAIAIQYDPKVWNALHVNINNTHFTWKNGINEKDGHVINIGGKDYVMLVATYQKALAANEISPAMMMQLALDDVTITNDQLANTLDMRVTTVAIEADIFKDENGVPLTAEEALEKAVPLEYFNPFR